MQVMWEQDFDAHVMALKLHMARVDNGQLTFTKICFYFYNSSFDLLLKWNLIQHFQELEFTGVMRFYYQAQDMDSGQKVGLVFCFFLQIRLKLFLSL